MIELDRVWVSLLDDATAKAIRAGRTDLADYLRLRATNDAIRNTGVAWLFDTMIEIATRPSQRAIKIERDDPHSFTRGSSNMVGSRLQIRHGVRCLTVEAGWARTPSDGIMQKGSLAFARFTHFGMPRETSEFRLVHAASLPHWLSENDAIIDSFVLQRHFELLAE